MRSSLRFDVEQTGVVEPKLVVGAHTATIDRNATPATAAWMKPRRVTQSSVSRRVGPRSAFWTRIGTESYGFDWPGGAARSELE